MLSRVLNLFKEFVGVSTSDGYVCPREQVISSARDEGRVERGAGGRGNGALFLFLYFCSFSTRTRALGKYIGDTWFISSRAHARRFDML